MGFAASPRPMQGQVDAIAAFSRMAAQWGDD